MSNFFVVNKLSLSFGSSICYGLLILFYGNKMGGHTVHPISVLVLHFFSQLTDFTGGGNSKLVKLYFIQHLGLLSTHFSDATILYIAFYSLSELLYFFHVSLDLLFFNSLVLLLIHSFYLLYSLHPVHSLPNYYLCLLSSLIFHPEHLFKLSLLRFYLSSSLHSLSIFPLELLLKL